MSQPNLQSPLSRRTALRLGAGTTAGIAGAFVVGGDLVASMVGALPSSSAAAADTVTAGCTTLTVEKTQGPFWIDERLNRSDIRSDSGTGAVRPGVPLTLTFTLLDAGGNCTPQAGAIVDVWHADAQGTYSDVSGQGNPNNIGVDWLRGYQVADANGQVTFTTIWPGYYNGRTIHIHFRVRSTLDNAAVNFTSQLFFDESANALVLAQPDYQKGQARSTFNANDGIYDSTLLSPVSGSVAAGYQSAFTVYLDYGDGASTPTSDTSVAATLVSAKVVRRPGGRRRVKVVLHNQEAVTVRYRLVRHDDVLAVRRTGWLTPATRTMRLGVPRNVTAGRARVVLKLTDKAGNTKIARLPVTVPTRS